MSTSRQPQTEPPPAYRIACSDPLEGVVDVRLEGSLTFADGGDLWQTLSAGVPPAAQSAVHFDLSGLDSIDGGAMALLVQTKWNLQTAGVTCDFSGGTGDVAKILALYEGDASPTPRPPRVRVGFFGHVGNQTHGLLKEVQLLLAFVGSMVLAVGGVLRRPRTGNWRDIAPIMTRSGAEAMPIVTLITFLIGFVMAFQSAAQLKQFGANILVADLVGISVTRELGPLMTAMIVCGRSGAAFAAELGTMKVSEEIDALRTMGIGPLRFLVFPRVIALVLVLPVLTLFGDLMAILGGMVVGVVNLDLTITSYVNETRGALALWDIGQGLIKSGAYGLAIGLISCAQGLATTGGAEGVGRRTTAAVVASSFALILLDAVLTFAFHELGL